MFDFDLLPPLTTAVADCAGLRTAVSTPACPASASGGAGVLAKSQRSQVFVDDLERIAQILVGT